MDEVPVVTIYLNSYYITGKISREYCTYSYNYGDKLQELLGHSYYMYNDLLYLSLCKEEIPYKEHVLMEPQENSMLLVHSYSIPFKKNACMHLITSTTVLPWTDQYGTEHQKLGLSLKFVAHAACEYLIFSLEHSTMVYNYFCIYMIRGILRS